MTHPTAVVLTHHARARLRQRGLRESDLELVLTHGTRAGRKIVLTDRDAAREVACLKRLIARIERLRGATVALAPDDDGVVLTAIKSDRRAVGRMLRVRASHRPRPHRHRRSV